MGAAIIIFCVIFPLAFFILMGYFVYKNCYSGKAKTREEQEAEYFRKVEKRK